ncbi:RNA polymerase sigma factor [Oceanobacillus sp. FSL W8-0428]|uniref:RNA polymerase sigma factor n=1 Tax=Oceanobacillus sp. FSL W8-0428 TaxID=2921715 RepID=UPI0030FB902D
MIFKDLKPEINKLYKYCLKLSASPWRAEDLVQETMLKTFQLKKLEPEREFTFSFLCTVAKNLYIDEQRKNRRESYLNEDFHGIEYDFIESSSLIEALLTALPLKQAMLITLKDVFGYTSKEIAAMLRVRDESVKTALHRSRKKLKLNADIEMIQSVSLPDDKIIPALSKAIAGSQPMQIFFYYRQLEAQNFQVRRTGAGRAVFHVIDPDGNILELLSS